MYNASLCLFITYFKSPVSLVRIYAQGFVRMVMIKMVSELKARTKLEVIEVGFSFVCVLDNLPQQEIFFHTQL